MKPENRIVTFMKKLVGYFFTERKKAEKEEESNKLKEVMCRRAIDANVCPKACERCAWHVMEE